MLPQPDGADPRRLLTAIALLLLLAVSVVPVAAEQWTHCHPSGRPHTHSRFASGLPLDEQYRRYVDGNLGSPVLHDDLVTIPAGWHPADDPAWHNHGDDDTFIVSCQRPASSPVPPVVVPRPPSVPPAIARPPVGGGGGGGGRASAPATATPTGGRQAAPAVAMPPATATVAAPVYPVPVGWINRAGTEIGVGGFVRDQHSGSTYALLRRELDDVVVRYWVAPDSSIAQRVPWNTPAVRNMSTAELRRIPLDERYPLPDMLVQLEDGRIIHWDTVWPMWRHIPDIATFQALGFVRGFHWCDVTAADAEFIERITLDVAHPTTWVPARVDYPVCG